MKSYLYAFVLILFCLSAGAQVPQTHKVVYLKDGSNIKGTVTVNDSAGYVMVIDIYNEPHYYQKTMVAKIDSATQRRRTYTLKPKGYTCNIEIGGTDIIAPRGGTNIPAFSFNIINSYLFSPYASIGMGIGAEIAGSNTETFSLYANSRIYFIKSDISPYLDLDFGYNLLFSNSNYQGLGVDVLPPIGVSHGMMANPSFGVRVAASKKVALTASIGYKLYYIHNSTFFDYNSFHESINYTYSLGHAPTFKVGFQF